MKKVITLFIACFIAGIYGENKKVSHAYDLDVSGGMYLAPVEKSHPTNIVGIEAKYESKTNISKAFIPLAIELDGYTAASRRLSNAKASLTYPVNFIASGGLGFDGKIKLCGEGFVHMMSSNNELALPWSSSNSDFYNYGSIKQYYRIGGDVSFELPLEKINIDIFSHNNISAFGYTNSLHDSLNSSNQLDHDWWITPTFTFKPFERLFIKAEYLRKNELDNSGAYDIDMVWLGLETNLKLLKRKMLRIYGDFNGRYYRSDVMSEKGYLENGDKTGALGLESHIRTFFKLKKKWYLKGDMLVDISSLMQKQRYEIAIRKVSKSGTLSGEAGSWGTFGSLFPRLCSYGRGRLGVNEYFAFLPQAKAYFRWDDEKYSYYRTDLGLELEGRLPVRPEKIFTSLYILGGADYKMYSWEEGNSMTYDNKLSNFFPTNLNLYLGLRTFL